MKSHQDATLNNCEADSLEIDLELIGYLFKQNLTFIACITLICIALGSAFAFLGFQEQYSSQATVILNTDETPNIVTNYKLSDSFFKGVRVSNDPFKNQEELLKSRFIAEKVFKRLQSSKTVPSLKKLQDLTRKNVLQIEHANGSNFIHLSVSWKRPKEAYYIAKAYLKAYQEVSEEISKSPIQKQRLNLENQLGTIEKELAHINQEIQQYQETNEIVNIDKEGELLLSRLDAQIKSFDSIVAEMAEKKGEIDKLKKQLQLDTQTAISSVANGQNEVYSSLSAKLTEAVQDYNIKALTYSPTNPDMVEIKEKIAVLKDQIADQGIITIGRKLKSDEVVIMDDVRREMVKRLATLEAEYAALKNKWGVSQDQLKSMETSVEELPTKQLTYANLLLGKKNKEIVLNKLKENLAEIRIQESTLPKKLQVVDMPNIPQKPAAPNRLHIIFIAFAAGLVLPASGVVGVQYLRNQTARPSFIENTLGVPVLGILPWLPDEKWSFYQAKRTLKDCSGPAFEKTITAYQNLTLNLKVQESIHQRKVLAMASTFSDDRKGSYTLVNLAMYLAQSGDRVVLVDANFRKPLLHSTLGDALDYEKGLTETINELSECLSQSPEATSETLYPIIQKQLLPTSFHSNMLYLNAGIEMKNTFEFLNSKGFTALIKVLKENFDWVLVDAPALLKGSDTYVMAHQMDGILICIEQQATKQHVELALKKLKQVNASLAGAIVRDLDKDDSFKNKEFFETLNS